MYKIYKLIKLSNLNHFIKNSEEGLLARVVTKGIKLLVVKIQTIGIARALYRDPNIIFFDEGISSLDDKNETIILDNIFKAFAEKTIFFAIHKKLLVRYFDKVIKINNSRISYF